MPKLVSFTLTLAFLIAPLAATAQQPPNILFIYTDDQGPWALGCAGHPQAHTPNVDRLFQEGARFTNSFVVTPVCSPSRASLMTSRYGSELGITDWINPKVEPEVGLEPGIATWPKLLSEAGYETCLVGKWHLGTQDRYHPSVHGYEVFRGFRPGGMTVADPVLEIDGATKECKGLTVDIHTDLAIDFLKRDRGDRPFLLSLHYRSPHAPWLPVADEDWKPYEGVDLLVPNPGFPNLDVPQVKQKTRDYLSSVTGVDRNVGRLLKVLDELGLRDKTLVVFTSDNGYNIGHHGVYAKGNARWITTDVKDLPKEDPRRLRSNMFDTSLKVPTGIRWPGVVEPGSTIEETVSCLDWFPTLLAAAGVSCPTSATIRGRSFLPLLKGEEVGWDNDVYTEYSQHHYVQTGFRSYRTPEWKLVRDFLRQKKDELYHLAEDPEETQNLIDDPRFNDVREQLDKKIRAKMAEVGDDPFGSARP